MPPGSTDRAGFLAAGHRILHEVARAGLARFADAFVEEGAFAQDEVRPFLEEAGSLGLGLKLHVDQLRAGQRRRLRCQPRRRLGRPPRVGDAEGIARLARARVTAVLIPTATLVLRLPRYAPGRALVDAGVGVAIASNCNPAALQPRTWPSRCRWPVCRTASRRSRPSSASLAGVARHSATPRSAGCGWEDRQTWWCSAHADVDHLVAHVGISHVQAVVRAGRIVLRSDVNARC
jgi:imidazolonepropionase